MTSPIRHILVATDLSKGSCMALQRAVQLARQHSASMTLLHVMRAGGGLPEWLAKAQPRLANADELAAEIRGRLTMMAVEAGIDPSVPLSIEVRIGKPAQVVAEYAIERQIDVLAVGAHGESGVIDSILGTTTQKIVRLTETPVLVVHQTPRGSYRNVLISTDFSTTSSASAHFAIRLAPKARAEIFHAYDVPYFTLMTHAGVSDNAMGDYRRLAHEDAQVAMRAHLDELGPAFEHAKTVLRHGYAPPLIQQYARDHDTDLVVVGAQGKSAISASLLGSISSRVLLESRCDVLVVKHT